LSTKGGLFLVQLLFEELDV
jgi:hypothetical protein